MSSAQAAPAPTGKGEVVEGKTVKQLTYLMLKRTFDMFASNHGEKLPLHEESQRAKVACKRRDEYRAMESLKLSRPETNRSNSGAAAASKPAEPAGRVSQVEKLIDTMPEPADAAAEKAKRSQLVLHTQPKTALIPTATGGQREYTPSAVISKRLASAWPRPEWHPPWKNYRVISGHLGWVRSVAFDPSNEWFVTGSGDRTIKVWETATGRLKLTLTGHIEQVTGLAVSPRHPYMFSCGLDKKVMCWDLEHNKVIRHYHGHLSGVYSLCLHPELDVLMSGGRDSVCRVWDMRTKVQVHCLSGHDQTVASIISQPTDPQIITGSHDSTIRLWDIRTGKATSTLTYHKKSVRAMAMHPHEFSFAAASAENIKKYKLPRGEFLHNMLQQQRSIVNCMAVNEDGVLVTGGDNGSIHMWDWRSGNRFQEQMTVVQPGSLESEAGIYAMTFDITGTRLITCEADKTIKMWKEDENATPATHPINFRPPREVKRY